MERGNDRSGYINARVGRTWKEVTIGRFAQGVYSSK